jgi:hypothetical protein
MIDCPEYTMVTAGQYATFKAYDRWNNEPREYWAKANLEEFNFASILSEGFTEPAHPIAWWCVFSDISEEDLDWILSLEIEKRDITPFFRDKSLNIDKRFTKSHIKKYEPYVKQFMAIKALALADLFCDRAILSPMEYSRIAAIKWVEAGDFCHYVLDASYSSLNYSSWSVLRSIMHPLVSSLSNGWGYTHEERGEIDEIKNTLKDNDFMAKNIKEYVWFLVEAADAVQKYCYKANKHPPNGFIQESFYRKYSAKEIDVIASSWSGMLFCLAKQKKLNWLPLENKRRIKYGLSVSCPV